MRRLRLSCVPPRMYRTHTHPPSLSRFAHQAGAGLSLFRLLWDCVEECFKDRALQRAASASTAGLAVSPPVAYREMVVLVLEAARRECRYRSPTVETLDVLIALLSVADTSPPVGPEAVLILRVFVQWIPHSLHDGTFRALDLLVVHVRYCISCLSFLKKGGGGRGGGSACCNVVSFSCVIEVMWSPKLPFVS